MDQFNGDIGTPPRLIWASDEGEFPDRALVERGGKIELVMRIEGKKYVHLLKPVEVVDCVLVAQQVLEGKGRRGSMEEQYLKLAAGLIGILDGILGGPNDGETIVPDGDGTVVMAEAAE